MPRILTPSDIAQFRSRLCDVAAQLFAELGHAGFNMRELAKRLGVSAMTPYRYFEDKDAILSEVRARAFARFADWLEEAYRRRPAMTGTHAGRMHYAQFAIQEQTQYRLMFDLAQPAATSSPLLASQERRAHAALVSYARHMVERGVLTGDLELLGLLLWSTPHGVAALYRTEKLSGENFHAVLSNTISLFADCRVRAAGVTDNLGPSHAKLSARKIGSAPKIFFSPWLWQANSRWRVAEGEARPPCAYFGPTRMLSQNTSPPVNIFAKEKPGAAIRWRRLHIGAQRLPVHSAPN